MRRLILTACAALAAMAAFMSSPAFAWGYYGHRTVAAIAMDNIKPSTRAHIAQLLKAAPQLVTPQCKVKSLEDAAAWPDCLRGERWRWAYTFPWHYQDISICKAFNIKEGCANGTCVSAQIERNAKLLKDRRQPQVVRLEALAFLSHFVGDIHQPLHVGENDDQGGNKVKASYGIAPGYNLHSIWDTPEAERAITAASPPLVRRYSPAEKAALSGGSVEDWARESWQISRDVIYPEAFGKLPCDGKEPDHAQWSEAMIEKTMPIIDKRIQQAGLRLARMLDEALG